jgi:hypothetical protein
MITESAAYAAAINAPYRVIVPLVDVYFEGDDQPPVTFDKTGLCEVHLLDEVSADTSNPLGLVSANELTVGFNNLNRPFTPQNTASPYYGKLTPNIKVVAYLEVWLVALAVTTSEAAESGANSIPVQALTVAFEDGEQLVFNDPLSGDVYVALTAAAAIGAQTLHCSALSADLCPGTIGVPFADVPLGVFRTTDWSSPSSNLEATVTCEDLLYYIGQENVPMLHVVQGTTIGGLFELLFQALGLTSDQYNIDPSLTQPVAIGWIPDDSYQAINTVSTSSTTNMATGATITTPVLDALQALAIAGCVWVTCDRYGVIQVQSIFTPGDPVTTWADNTMINQADNPQKFMDIYSQVVVNYNIPYIQASESLLEIQNQIIPTGTTVLSNLCFTDGPVVNLDSVYLSGAVNSRITAISWGAWTLTLTVENTGAQETVTVEAVGEAVGLITSTVTVQDDAAVASIGVKTLTVSCPLIQDQATAQEYAQTLLNFCKDPTVKFTLTIRGDPAVEVRDIVQLVDNVDKIGTVNVVPTRIQLDYDGALSGQVDARKPVTAA